MKRTQLKSWIGVVIQAVLLGLAVVYMINVWLPEDVAGWILLVVSLLIAIRSIMRLGELAKEIDKKEPSAEEQE